MSRRSFIALAAAGGAAAAQLAIPAEAAAPARVAGRLVDVNVTLMQWPARRLPLDESEMLANKLRSHGVVEAWASSFEGLLSRDLAGVNARLVEACRRSKIFVPFGCVNPAHSWWKEDLERCANQHRMHGIRLFPGYHGYTLNDGSCMRLIERCAEKDLAVQIAVTLEDQRVQHPRLAAAPVDLGPLPALLEKLPGLKLMLLGWNRGRNVKVVAPLATKGLVKLDISTQEGVAGITNLLSQVPAESVVFGSHAPFYVFESAMLKLQESELTPAQLAAIRSDNAVRWRKNE
jgi:predicted TIM-barrel fold metal-dependent hydrolase